MFRVSHDDRQSIYGAASMANGATNTSFSCLRVCWLISRPAATITRLAADELHAETRVLARHAGRPDHAQRSEADSRRARPARRAPLADEDAFRAALREHFGIELSLRDITFTTEGTEGTEDFLTSPPAPSLTEVGF